MTYFELQKEIQYKVITPMNLFYLRKNKLY